MICAFAGALTGALISTGWAGVEGAALTVVLGGEFERFGVLLC